MKNPFRFFKSSKDNPKHAEEAAIEEAVSPVPSADEEETEAVDSSPSETAAPEDGFIEWSRSRTRGGIERRERNDIYEAYSVYGTDGEGLICRLYHRYPEHEKDFGLSYSRTLTFSEFNARLLSELDKGSLTTTEYNDCILRAAELSGETAGNMTYDGFSQEELDAMHAFCESLENITEKSYRYGEGIYRCDGESVVGGERLNIWFRRPTAHDALGRDTAGVKKTPINSYDIDDIWIMGVCNRLRESGVECEYFELSSEWSLSSESVYLIAAEKLSGIEGKALIAVAKSENFYRFGFYSLDFSNK